jgi:hypothetical protein
MGCKSSKDGIKYKMVLLKIQRVLVRKERRELAEKYEKITGKKVVLRNIRDYIEDKEKKNVKGRTRKGKVEITLRKNVVKKGKISKCKKKKIQKRKRFYDEDKIVIDKQEGFCSINKVNDWVVDKQEHLRKQMMMITPLKRNNNYVIEDSNNISFSNNSNCNCISNDQTTDKSTNIKQQIQSTTTTTNNFLINNNNNNIQHKLNISTFPNINITTTTTNINTIKYTPPTQLKHLLYKHQILSGLKKQLPFEESIETE